MTVDELRKLLDECSANGHGKKKVYMSSNGSRLVGADYSLVRSWHLESDAEEDVIILSNEKV